MPGGDKTGPLGAGPLTGRGAGFCRGNSVAGYANRIGRGGGTRGGRGGYVRGNRYQFFATGRPGWMRGARVFDPIDQYPQHSGRGAVDDQEELDLLMQEAHELRAHLEDLEQRIASRRQSGRGTK